MSNTSVSARTSHADHRRQRQQLRSDPGGGLREEQVSERRTKLAAMNRPVRVVELLAALSLATDLGTGQPMEHGLRTCVLAGRAGEKLGLDATQRSDVRHVTLLRFLGCTADASDTAAVVGDEIAFNRAMAPVVMADNREALRRLIMQVGRGKPAARRVATVAAVLSDPGGKARSLRAHCEVGARLAIRIGLGPEVTDALAHAYERWDGKGLPVGLAGEAVPFPVRIAAVARDVDVWAAAEGWDRTALMLQRRRGRAYDPAVSVAFLSDGSQWLDELTKLDPWDAVTSAEPAPVTEIEPDRLEQVLAAVADFADLKSPWFVGHSRAVAALAEAAATGCGLDGVTAKRIGLSALVHDLGIVGVSAGIWNTPGPLTTEAWERVRLHPYFTERILSRCIGLGGLLGDAGHHHERADGCGYHRGARELSVGAQLVAAADVYSALCEDRPCRPAVTPDAAARVLTDEADAGRLGRAAIDAVLAAAGHKPAIPNMPRPAGLTEREIDVLRLIARGHSNKETAAELGISAKTVGTHVEHLYAKAGVTTRAGATLFAMEHNLLRA
jgi:HD-GYP domain-containing protein (c-di-GMP phosphodiesterase class II)